MLELVAALGVVINGVVAQVLAFLLAQRTASAATATVRATIPTLPVSVPPTG